ncbi:MAG: raffinose/stachyose/melibiose transport system substrate-binding protein [Epulopiscium sp.]|jgi:ABC-type glycerol-3-phosphate transport system substrate-binding protein|uniref:Extracellular solute-binding protein n=1 Tax=Defluviitalea raffinosedens TaxID=1450156 RepID=A0A7C8LD92_9FIRM|nr:ABC transporter substrate-binding protein [Defluviitalea raffinosedens]MDK2788491.1 raffinose/stachyose/melibiose transport system substrate-binding protein [Candidatus Epulonipiscium sp.]KAE9634098.1 extracellular solute-binding protein [Defluviitalea raffinosedens]MBM7686802.1 ABC-type glycerol-3-phosphate transport system substrate-binding protein [Defluviitalea raffinosedens]NLK96841.1 carbohydrate ABC transporter substrate-binding protein [Candidatus Epulonipiscium sp.]HHW68042.1 carbo
MKLKKFLSLLLVTGMVISTVACSGNGQNTTSDTAEQSKVTEDGKQQSGESEVPAIYDIKLGEDFKDLKADIHVLTDRTDIADTVYAGYAEEFKKLYPNINVEYEAITDYAEAVTLRLTTGDWGDICFVPTSVDKDEFPNYFISFGDADKISELYNFASRYRYDGQIYAIPNGGNAQGIVYNKKVFEKAGITEMPKTPDEFLDALQKIKDNTDAVPMYSNFAAKWTMGAWDAYIGGSATGDPDFMNKLPHLRNPFSKREDMTGPYAVYYVLYEATKRGLIEDDPSTSDWESSKGMMNRGEIGTMVLGSWAVKQMQEAGDNPDDVGYMPFPITVNGKQYATAGGNYAYGINKDISKERQIASLIYVKWLLEMSPIFEDEGSIPALKNAPMPSVLDSFKGVEFVIDNPPKEGEETLFDDVNNESEIGINNNDYKVCQILEHALYGTKSFDDIMNEWNEKWSKAQEKLNVEVYQ